MLQWSWASACFASPFTPRTPSPHAVALLQALNRHMCKANNRVKEGNFSLNGLLGFDLYQKTVGVVGTGGIGLIFAKIMYGFGCNVIAYDPYQNDELPKIGKYVELDELWAQSDIISFHVPLMPSTHHMVNEAAIAKMKKGVFLINTARGALLDTSAIIKGLKTGKLGAVGMDVVEGEQELFFEDHSEHVMQDDKIARLLSFSNVLITGHMAFFTKEALHNIAATTVENASAFTGAAEINPRNICVHDGRKAV
mmetsp:Transcript_62448/g.135666  ORF Transcript_62448/g.135666 Transcript_62448/m.135666 type:complete len:253 (-) Transcript_62448:32-790(-)